MNYLMGIVSFAYAGAVAILAADQLVHGNLVWATFMGAAAGTGIFVGLRNLGELQGANP